MERDFIRWLRDRLPAHPALKLPAGDDAASVDLSGADCLCTVDMLMDQVDFDLRVHSPERIGRKALAVNLSDIAAMAGRPVAALIALALPRGAGPGLAEGLYQGLLPLAEQFQVAIAGGDTNSWNAPLAISVTVLGVPTGAGPLCRSGARPSDRILVTGPLGGSLLGHHFNFTPRVAEAQFLHANYELHAAIDVSDGLAVDLGHLLAESGLGAILEAARVPLSADAVRLASEEHTTQKPGAKTAWEHALSDGEDFELILAVPPAEAARLLRDRPAGLQLSDVGEFLAEPGLFCRDPDGTVRPLPLSGYEHRW